MKTRAIWFQLHRWLALVAALPLVILGLTGAMMTFESELDRLLNPRLWNVTPRGERLSWQTVVDRVHQAYSRERVAALRLPRDDDQAAEVSLRSGRLVYVDPYAGTVLGSRLRGEILMAKIHQFHTNLWLGRRGSMLMGCTALALLFLSGSGMVLWWRAKLLHFSWQSAWPRWHYDSHHAMGMYGLAFWIVLGVTGAMMSFEDFAQPALNWLTRSPPPEEPRLKASASADAKPIAIDQIIATAEQTLPGARVAFISLPLNAAAVSMVAMKYPEDRTPGGRSRVYVDPYNGLAVWKISTRDVPLGTWLWFQHRSLHTGDVFGWPTRLLACAASLLAVFQVYTGAWLWWKKGRQRAAGSRQ
jgi:uncharacterized iron-regulated membrane protein